MKVILEFNDEELQRADQSFHGPEYAAAIQDFQEYLRQERKHGNYNDETQLVVEKIEQSFYNIFEGLVE